MKVTLFFRQICSEKKSFRTQSNPHVSRFCYYPLQEGHSFTVLAASAPEHREYFTQLNCHLHSLHAHLLQHPCKRAAQIAILSFQEIQQSLLFCLLSNRQGQS